MDEPTSFTAAVTCKNTLTTGESPILPTRETDNSTLEREALSFIKNNVKPAKKTKETHVSRDRDELRFYNNMI